MRRHKVISIIILALILTSCDTSRRKSSHQQDYITNSTNHEVDSWSKLKYKSGQVIYAEISRDTTNCPELLNNSSQCIWTFFTLTDTTNGIVVKHEQQHIGCGTKATASLTIIKTDNDTIRVLDLCNQSNYLVGCKVKIEPVANPNFQVQIPSYLLARGQQLKKMKSRKKDYRKNKTENELPVWCSNEFDRVILKTTWGNIISDN